MSFLDHLYLLIKKADIYSILRLVHSRIESEPPFRVGLPFQCGAPCPGLAVRRERFPDGATRLPCLISEHQLGGEVTHPLGQHPTGGRDEEGEDESWDEDEAEFEDEDEDDWDDEEDDDWEDPEEDLDA